MAARSGMLTIIGQLRPMIGLGTAEFTINGTAYYSDEQIQDHLDRYRIDLTRHRMTPVVEYTGGTDFYYRYITGYQNMEELSSGYGTAYKVEDEDGDPVGTADFTPNYLLGEVRFDSDTGGSSRWITARSYDLDHAALAIWREIASHTTPFYQFAADDQRFNRDQWHEHALEQIMVFERATGIRSAKWERIDI